MFQKITKSIFPLLCPRVNVRHRLIHRVCIKIHVSYILTNMIIIQLMIHQALLLNLPAVEILYLIRDTRRHGWENHVQKSNAYRQRCYDWTVRFHPKHENVIAALAVNINRLHLALAQLRRLVTINTARVWHNTHNRVLVIGIVEITVPVVFIWIDTTTLILSKTKNIRMKKLTTTKY